MQLNRKGLWSSCNSSEHKPVPYKTHTLLLIKSQATVIMKEKFSFQLKKKKKLWQWVWYSSALVFRLSYDNGYKGHFVAVEVKQKSRRKLFLVDVYVKILSIYFSILTPSHPTQSWLLFNNTRNKNRGRKKNIKHHQTQLGWSRSWVKAQVLETRHPKFIFQNYVQYCNSNNSRFKSLSCNHISSCCTTHII